MSANILACLGFRLALFILPEPLLILIKMPMSRVARRPHCICHLGQSPSHNYRRDYCFHNESKSTTLWASCATILKHFRLKSGRFIGLGVYYRISGCCAGSVLWGLRSWSPPEHDQFVMISGRKPFPLEILRSGIKAVEWAKLYWIHSGDAGLPDVASRWTRRSSGGLQPWGEVGSCKRRNEV